MSRAVLKMLRAVSNPACAVWTMSKTPGIDVCETNAGGCARPEGCQVSSQKAIKQPFSEAPEVPKWKWLTFHTGGCTRRSYPFPLRDFRRFRLAVFDGDSE